MRNHYIYGIKHLSKKRYYVGEASDYIRRLSEHMKCGQRGYLNKKNLYACRGLYLAMHKYGITDFIFKVLEVCDYEERYEREMYWIKKLNAASINGYNSLIGINPAQLKAICLNKKMNISEDEAKKIICKKNNIEYYDINHIDKELIEYSKVIKELIEVNNIDKQVLSKNKLGGTKQMTAKGFTNIYILKNIITNQLYIGTSQLKNTRHILEKLYLRAHDKKRVNNSTELYEYIKKYNITDFEVDLIERNIEIDRITDNYKLKKFLEFYSIESLEFLLSEKQQQLFKKMIL